MFEFSEFGLVERSAELSHRSTLGPSKPRQRSREYLNLKFRAIATISALLISRLDREDVILSPRSLPSRRWVCLTFSLIDLLFFSYQSSTLCTSIWASSTCLPTTKSRHPQLPLPSLAVRLFGPLPKLLDSRRKAWYEMGR